MHSALLLLALAVRLAVWRWREFYPLGGDEQEYLSAAVTLLRDRQYVELRFMRPPLYPIFLAAAIYLVDSLVQSLRLAQAILSAATVPLVYLLAREATLLARGPAAGRAPAFLAALLCALSYTLAANATELLSETLFLAGLTATLWLLLRAGRTGSWAWAAAAGLALGALCLVRSVALPLLPLGVLWLAVSMAHPPRPGLAPPPGGRRGAAALRVAAAYGLAAALVILPWTARNYLAYGGLILIDTTGAENLWLDNDPAGREAVKAQLYALGDDRLARQRLGSERGAAVILADPARFAAKAWGELLKFFALEYSDDMRARPAIWLPPAEVWARLLLGDALWLLILLAGGLSLARELVLSSAAARGGGATDQGQGAGWRRALRSPAWLLAPWAAYVLLTAVVFHVELRYRLPLYPALLVYAALALTQPLLPAGRRVAGALVALLAPAACLALTLLHAPYPALAAQLGAKHWLLGRAEAALGRGDAAEARAAAAGALARDEGSALARVALARAALLDGREGEALALLDAAAAAIPAHPQAHLLRGDLLRRAGDLEAARAGLAYEGGSLEDLQAWAWGRFLTPPPARLDLGDGLDLGFLQGMHAAEAGGFRWTEGGARLRLGLPPGATALTLRVAAGRPDGSAVPLTLLAGGRELAALEVRPGWADYRVELPAAALAGDSLVLELRAPTFRPRQFDPASPDGRALGVMLDYAAVEPAASARLPRSYPGAAGDGTCCGEYHRQ